jgi:hypothetical protein
VHGQQAGENHRADEAQREVIGKQFRASHFRISIRVMRKCERRVRAGTGHLLQREGPLVMESD